MIITTRLVAGLPAEELKAKIDFHMRQGEVADRAVGFYLLDMDERREHTGTRVSAQAETGPVGLAPGRGASTGRTGAPRSGRRR